MRAILSGGKNHGKETEIENAWTNLKVCTDPPRELGDTNPLTTFETYELVSIKENIALYRIGRASAEKSSEAEPSSPPS